MLFTGPPGTGKTLVAEVLARELGSTCSASTSRASSRSGSARPRRTSPPSSTRPSARRRCCCSTRPTRCSAGARRSVDAHDRYANLETGVPALAARALRAARVLATNLRQNIDPAFTRRLEFVVEFDEPDADRARGALALPPAGARAGRRGRRPRASSRALYPVVGGVIRNAATRAAFLAAADGGAISRRPSRRRDPPRVREDRTRVPRLTDRARPSQGGLMADTLLGVVQDALTKATDEQKRAKEDLVAAQADLAQAQQELADATTQVLAHQNTAIEIRRRIAEATVAADGKKLFDDLDANTTALRQQQAAMADAQETIAFARSRVAGAQDELARAAAAAQALAAAVTRGETARRRPDGVGGEGEVRAALGAAGGGRRDEARAGEDGGRRCGGARRRRRRRRRPDGALHAGARATDAARRPAGGARRVGARRRGPRRRRGGEGGPRRQARPGEAHDRPQRRRPADVRATAQERFDRALALLEGVKNGPALNAARDGARAGAARRRDGRRRVHAPERPRRRGEGAAGRSRRRSATRSSTRSRRTRRSARPTTRR